MPFESPRIRVTLAESETARPANTDVLFRQRVWGVMLCGALAALLCLPAYRYAFTDQAQAAWLGQNPAWTDIQPQGPGAQAGRYARIQAVLRAHPDDLHLQAGALLAGGVTGEVAGQASKDPPGAYDPRSIRQPRLEYMEALHRKAPGDLVLLAHLLRYEFLGSVKIQRVEVPRRLEDPEPSRLLVPEVVAQIEALVAQGERQDPENGYFPSMLAATYFAAGRDEEALAALHRASLCRTWKDYAAAEADSARDLMIRAFGDRGFWMHVMPRAAVLFPHFAQLRLTARMAAWHANRAHAAGDFGREHAVRTDVIRLGSLMRRETESVIGRLVGQAMATIGYPRAPEKEGRSVQETQSEQRRVRAEYVERVRREAPDQAALVSETLTEIEARAAQSEAEELTRPWNRLTDLRRLMDTAAFTLLLNVGVGLGFWLLAAAASFGAHRLVRRQPEGKWRGFHAVPMAALAVLAAGCGTAWLAQQQSLPEFWSDVSLGWTVIWYDGPRPERIYAVHDLAVPLAVALPAIAGLFALCRRTSLLGALEGLRTCAKATTGVLAVAYVTFLLWSVPADVAATQAFERAVQQETRGVR